MQCGFVLGRLRQSALKDLNNIIESTALFDKEQITISLMVSSFCLNLTGKFTIATDWILKAGPSVQLDRNLRLLQLHGLFVNEQTKLGSILTIQVEQMSQIYFRIC